MLRLALCAVGLVQREVQFLLVIYDTDDHARQPALTTDEVNHRVIPREVDHQLARPNAAAQGNRDSALNVEL